MRRITLFWSLFSVVVTAQAPGSIKPVIDNDRVVVWDLKNPPGAADADAVKGAQGMDSLAVYLAPPSIQGKVEFVARGGAIGDTIQRSGASRIVIINFRDRLVAPLPNHSGLPDAFPRPRSKKVLDNSKVMVWDYTFDRGDPSPMHFHPRDVVTIYLKDGALISTTPDGTKTDNEFSYGTIRFNPSNRAHTEILVKGESRIIAAELK